jgi:SAM-dependent methyltransferase/uncharacterized protein YbaR (Trm112 family)
MKIRHFERFRPVCPGCRGEGPGVPVVIGTVWAGTADEIEQGTLHCPACFREFPIIDGAPVLVPSPRDFVAQNAAAFLERDDLPAGVASLVGECAGPGSFFDASRQHLSTYVWSHWGDQDPSESDRSPGLTSLIEAGVARAPVIGPVLDLGCAVGRATFELAARSDDLVLGCDIHVPMLRLARRILREGRVGYDRRRVGLIYDRREFDVSVASERVDFWYADAMALPFPSASIGTYHSLNLIDCLPNPYGHLTLVADLLAAGGHAILATPFDWSTSVTPVEYWVGGHGPRTPHAGSSAALLAALLTPGAHPGSISGLSMISEAEVPWVVRLHERASMHYRAWVAVARATR